MVYSLQKATIWKRTAAWLLDAILVCVLATGFAFLLSVALGYDSYNGRLNDGYARYEAQYGISFDISYEERLALTEDARQNWDAAYNALIQDPDVIYAYNMVINLTLLIVAISILLSVVVWEFLLPLWLKNGQTVGKKAFGLCLIRNDGVQVNNLQLMTRALLGKYTLETMIPVFVLLTLYLGTGGGIGLLIVLALFLGQAVCLCVSRTNAAIHDLLAGTVVVDLSSQLIFKSTDDLIAYQKRVAAEQAARQTY